MGAFCLHRSVALPPCGCRPRGRGARGVPPTLAGTRGAGGRGGAARLARHQPLLGASPGDVSAAAAPAARGGGGNAAAAAARDRAEKTTFGSAPPCSSLRTVLRRASPPLAARPGNAQEARVYSRDMGRGNSREGGGGGHAAHGSAPRSAPRRRRARPARRSAEPGPRTRRPRERAVPHNRLRARAVLRPPPRRPDPESVRERNGRGPSARKTRLMATPGTQC